MVLKTQKAQLDHRFNTATTLKISAMAVSIPRYVGILFYASGLSFTAAWGIAHFAELIAGCALALLEGFAISYMVDRVQQNTSKIEQGAIIIVACLLLLLLPLAAIPSMYFAYTGNSLFDTLANNASEIAKICATCTWLFSVAIMPILIIIGVGLTQSDPMERKLKQEVKRAETEQRIAELRATTEQRIAEMDAQTKQTLLHYQLENRQTRANYEQETSRIKQDHRVLPFVCVCKQQFETVKALNGHKASCEQWKQQANGKAKEAEHRRRDERHL